jgi:thiamine pyrophosphokinase
MRCIIFANGEYVEMGAYQNIIRTGDSIICVDGGANYAYQLGLKPDLIVGDLDSILPEVEAYYAALGVPFKRYPPRKDPTDIMLCLETVREWGAQEVIMLGSLGKRLDHTLGNLYAGIDLVRQGVRVSHFSPPCWVYIIDRELTIEGQPGDLVSVLALTELARGVIEQNFEYSPFTTVLELSQPYAISNVLTNRRGTIGVDEGILAVFHYYEKPGP